VDAKMANAISEDAQIHISVAFLIKAMVAVAVVTGSWYQAQMKFAEQERRIKDLENKVTVLNAAVEGIETQHIQKLEQENKTLMERLGIKRK
jgi:Tfp pilus assembly protein PilN